MTVGSKRKKYIEKNLERKRTLFTDKLKNPILWVKFREMLNPSKTLEGKTITTKKRLESYLTPEEMKEAKQRGNLRFKKGSFGEEAETGFIKVKVNKKKAKISLFYPTGYVLGTAKVPIGMKRQGNGAAVLHQTLEELKKRGVEKVELEAADENAAKFYKTFGFNEYSREYNEDGSCIIRMKLNFKKKEKRK